MLIKDLITKLQELEDSFDLEYRQVMGEPSIKIDVFTKVQGFEYYQYAGISGDIEIEQSGDGVYYILSAFANPNNRQPK